MKKFENPLVNVEELVISDVVAVSGDNGCPGYSCPNELPGCDED